MFVQPYAVMAQSTTTGEYQRVDVVAPCTQAAVDDAMSTLSADWVYICAEACDPDTPMDIELEELTYDPGFDWESQCMVSPGVPHYTENDCIY